MDAVETTFALFQKNKKKNSKRDNNEKKKEEKKTPNMNKTALLFR